MVHIESEINALLLSNQPTSGVGKALLKAKNVLNSSHHIVDSIHSFGKNLSDEVGGVGGKTAGWIVGKSTKIVGGIGGKVLAGTLKTVAGVIPDETNPKDIATDLKIASLVEAYPLPTDKTQLLELLQWIHGHVNSSNTPYGKSTIKSLKTKHPHVWNALKIAAEDDDKILKLAKSYAPKKKFGLF